MEQFGSDCVVVLNGKNSILWRNGILFLFYVDVSQLIKVSAIGLAVIEKMDCWPSQIPLWCWDRDRYTACSCLAA